MKAKEDWRGPGGGNFRTVQKCTDGNSHFFFWHHSFVDICVFQKFPKSFWWENLHWESQTVFFFDGSLQDTWMSLKVSCWRFGLRVVVWFLLTVAWWSWYSQYPYDAALVRAIFAVSNRLDLRDGSQKKSCYITFIFPGQIKSNYTSVFWMCNNLLGPVLLCGAGAVCGPRWRGRVHDFGWLFWWSWKIEKILPGPSSCSMICRFIFTDLSCLKGVGGFDVFWRRRTGFSPNRWLKRWRQQVGFPWRSWRLSPVHPCCLVQRLAMLRQPNASSHFFPQLPACDKMLLEVQNLTIHLFYWVRNWRTCLQVLEWTVSR